MGRPLWDRTYGSPGTSVFNSIIAVPDGNYLITGLTYSSKSDSSYFYAYLLKIIADQYAYKDSLYAFKIPLFDADSLNCGYVPVKTPVGMTISPGGTISWTPSTDSACMKQVEYVIVKDTGCNDTLRFNCFVNVDRPGHVVVKAGYKKNAAEKPPEGTIALTCSGTTIYLSSSIMSLTIYDINGRIVDRLYRPESKTIVWPRRAGGKRIPAGRYFAKISNGKTSVVKPFLFVRH